MVPWKKTPFEYGKTRLVRNMKTVQNCSTQEIALLGTIH
jgi:hypothetical protein